MADEDYGPYKFQPWGIGGGPYIGDGGAGQVVDSRTGEPVSPYGYKEDDFHEGEAEARRLNREWHKAGRPTGGGA